MREQIYNARVCGEKKEGLISCHIVEIQEPKRAGKGEIVSPIESEKYSLALICLNA